MIILFHGISAYHGTRHPMQQIRAADRCIGAEICTATRPIGPIGIMVAGDIIEAYDRDVWSYVDENGRRQPGDVVAYSASEEGVDLEDPVLLERWLQWVANDPDSPGDYCEVFMRPRAITHVWVKPYVGKKTQMVARIIARRHGAQVITVHRNTRPWEVVRPLYNPDHERAIELAQTINLPEEELA